MTHQEWSTLYNQLRARADTYERRIDARLRKMAKRAGIDSGDYLYLHMNNAWVGRQANPWTGVDYTVLHQMRELEAKRWLAYRIVERWSKSSWKQVSR